MTPAIFDFSNIAHAIWYSTKNVDFSDCSDEAEMDELMFNSLTGRLQSKINSIMTLAGVREPIFVLDNYSIHKGDLYPQYKMQRSITGNSPIKMLEEWVKETYPDRVCYSPEHEADDVIATLCAKEESAVVISADRDLWQLLSQGIRIYCPFKKRFIQTSDLVDSFRLTSPKNVVLYKTCWGDACDNVPNVLPRMQKQLLPIIKLADGTMDRFNHLVEERWSTLTYRCQTLLVKGKAQLSINYQIVKLKQDCPLVWR